MDPSARGRRFLTKLDTNTSIRLLSCRLIWIGFSGWNGSSGLYDESLELSGSLEWFESGFPPSPVLGGRIFPLSPPPAPGSPMLLSLLGSSGGAGVSSSFSCGSSCEDGSGALDRSDLCSEIRPSGNFP